MCVRACYVQFFTPVKEVARDFVTFFALLQIITASASTPTARARATVFACVFFVSVLFFCVCACVLRSIF